VVANATTSSAGSETVADTPASGRAMPSSSLKAKSCSPSSGTFEGEDFADNRFLAFRRTEVLLSRAALVPPASACASGRHEHCLAYDAWCRNVREELREIMEIGDAIDQAI
jgi:hypothetical protein